MIINIDGKTASTAENTLYNGLGMVSANNSSRLLLDYKSENPQAYREILEYVFGEKGLAVCHLKIEMGSDINSSSGTEPSVMRYENEIADVTRGAGFQLAHDAKEINPALTLDMLWWSEPAWVAKSDDVYAARYKWYVNTLNAAYDRYQLVFDYISTNKNEREVDAEWARYLAKHIKEEKSGRYDLTKIRIAGADEVESWCLAEKMLADDELCQLVDCIGSHYTSWSDDNAKRLVDEHGKQAWMSEGSPPMAYAKGACRYDGIHSGLAGINGMLDIANRIITMYYGGKMTMCQLQPVVAAYYDGVTYSHKQMITACEPWSGHYELDSGFFMGLHFSQFIKKGWQFVESACFADGEKGGDGHAVVNATNSYLTACDANGENYSSVITNTTAQPLEYTFEVKNLDGCEKAVYVWETKGSDSDNEEYNKNYFRKISTIHPEKSFGSYSYKVVIAPYSLVTVTTLDVKKQDYAVNDSKVLSLPYEDDFDYSAYDEDFLSSRGNAPRYTTDQGGAFEVVHECNSNALMQIITPDIKAEEWGGTPLPTTNFGDDRWFNYSVATAVKFDDTIDNADCYAGVGTRFCVADKGESGLWLQLFADGRFNLKKNNDMLVNGNADIEKSVWTDIKICAVENHVTAYINNTLIADFDGDSAGISMCCAGRAALYSSYNRNRFKMVRVETEGENDYFITRYDDTDSLVNYHGEWKHLLMESFRNYKRTLSVGKSGDVAEFCFVGTGFSVQGLSEDNCIISVEIDGAFTAEGFTVPPTDTRESMYHIYGLDEGSHKAVIKVINGIFKMDSIEVVTNS